MWLLAIGIVFSMLYDMVMLFDCKRIAQIECSNGKVTKVIPEKRVRELYTFATLVYLTTMLAMLFVPKLTIVSAILFALSFSKTVLPKPLLAYCIFDKVFSIMLLGYALSKLI